MNADTDVLEIVKLAIREDIGTGDRTTEWTVPAERRASARIVARAPGTIAGADTVRLVFALVDRDVEVTIVRGDGEVVDPGTEVMRIAGAARSILTGERVALNFLQRLSGVATLARAYVEAVAGTAARVLDTRKTTPGMRRLEKQAVVAGGGENHRFGLHDMILIKENHIRAAGGIRAAIEAVARQNHAGLAVEVEVTNLDETRQALSPVVDRILFDNMQPDTLRACIEEVKRSGLSITTEASGGITLNTIRRIAETGVDFISVGALTHSAPALDLSLLLDDDWV